MYVAKFGGSSLADANQIQKVAQIIQNNPKIRIAVVSAPGSRFDEDIKVTDLLIALHADFEAGLDVNPAMEAILERFEAIINDLNLDVALIDRFKTKLETLMNELQSDSLRLLDALKAMGEDFCAQLLAEYMNQRGVKARYMSPLEVGITVTEEPGNARLLDESYLEIAAIKPLAKETLLIVPGFYGYSTKEQIVTFSRGGSDITGAIIARGVNAELYQNYTDVSYIYAAHPGIIPNPVPVEEITYREMRELAYSGFEIFHDEALTPLYKNKTPIQIFNTNDPEVEGTRIVSHRTNIRKVPIVGLSGATGFTSFTIKQYLLNREIGYARRLLQIFENLELSVEHLPTGIDDVTVVVRSHQFEGNNKREQLLEQIERQLEPEWIHVEDNLAIISIVGEGMRDMYGLANKATRAFTNQAISIQMINLGASEISIFFAIDARCLENALVALYEEYFE